MSHVSTFLHFRKQAEEAFKLYQSVFGGEIEGQALPGGDDDPVGTDPAVVRPQLRRLAEPDPFDRLEVHTVTNGEVEGGGRGLPDSRGRTTP